MNLNDILNGKTLPVYLINASSECYPILDFTLQQLQHKLEHSIKYKFNADRYFNFNEISQLLNTRNLFSDTIYIEVNYKNKPTLDHQLELKSIISKLDTNNTLVITCEKLTKKDYNSEWIKLINSSGLAVNLSENDIITVIKHQLTTANLTISNSALTMLQQLNQANLSQLLQVVNHLTILYPALHEISEEDVKQHSLDNSQYNIYQLSNAYLNTNLAQAIKILDNIYQKAEDAILIQWMIADDVRKLIQIKGYLQQKKSFTKITDELRIWNNTASLWQNTEQRIDYSSLLILLDQLANLDLTLKGVETGDIKQQLIQLITKLCSRG